MHNPIIYKEIGINIISPTTSVCDQGLTKKVEKLIFTPSTSICRRGGCKKFFLFSQPQLSYYCVLLFSSFLCTIELKPAFRTTPKNVNDLTFVSGHPKSQKEKGRIIVGRLRHLSYIEMAL